MSAYAILGVEEGAPIATVRKAWKRKARRLHPDKEGDTEEFQKLQNAYEQITLGNPTAKHSDSRTDLMRWAATYTSSSSMCRPPELYRGEIDKQDDTGRTALMYAAGQSHEALRILLESGADISLRNCGGHSALHFAYDMPKCLDVLIRAMANVNSSTHYGLTPLMLSAAKGNSEAATILLRAKADVDAASDVGFTALCMTADKGFLDCVRILVSAQASVNVRYRLGRTPLMSAASSGHTAVVNFLLEAKADKEVVCDRGLRAADYAATKQNDGLLCPQEVKEQRGARAALAATSCWQFCWFWR